MVYKDAVIQIINYRVSIYIQTPSFLCLQHQSKTFLTDRCIVWRQRAFTNTWNS